MPAQKKSSEIEGKISEFLEYLEVEKGSSPLTIRNYKHYLNRFVSWLKKEGIRLKLNDINPEIVRQYRVYLSRRSDGRPPAQRASGSASGTLSRRTQGYHVIALRSFLRWLIKNDFKVMSPDKIDLPKISERQVKFLTGNQVDRLLNAPSLSTIYGKRDKAILEVLYSTGLRVSELVRLDRDKVDLDRREFGVVGKGGKARVVFLSKRASEWIDNYLKSRKDKYKPLFIRHRGKKDITKPGETMRLSPRSIQRMLKKYVNKIKLPVDATPHVLRHSFATDLLMAGADIRSVQEMLGHKNIQTTQVYTHVTHKHLKDVHSAFHRKGGK
jgi:site-specific recombinase XerD